MASLDINVKFSSAKAVKALSTDISKAISKSVETQLNKSLKKNYKISIDLDSKKLTKSIDQLNNRLEQQARTIKNLKHQIAQLKKEYSDASKEATDGLSEQKKATDDVTKSTEDAVKANDELNKSVTSQIAEIGDKIKAYTDLPKLDQLVGIKEFLEKTGEGEDAITKLQETLQDAEKKMGEGAINKWFGKDIDAEAAEISNRLESIVEKIERQKYSTKAQRKEMEALRKEMEAMAVEAEGGLGKKILFDLKGGAIAMKDMFLNLAQTLGPAVLLLTLISAIKSALFDTAEYQDKILIAARGYSGELDAAKESTASLDAMTETLSENMYTGKEGMVKFMEASARAGMSMEKLTKGGKDSLIKTFDALSAFGTDVVDLGVADTLMSWTKRADMTEEGVAKLAGSFGEIHDETIRNKLLTKITNTFKYMGTKGPAAIKRAVAETAKLEKAFRAVGLTGEEIAEVVDTFASVNVFESGNIGQTMLAFGATEEEITAIMEGRYADAAGAMKRMAAEFGGALTDPQMRKAMATQFQEMGLGSEAIQNALISINKEGDTFFNNLKQATGEQELGKKLMEDYGKLMDTINSKSKGLTQAWQEFLIAAKPTAEFFANIIIFAFDLAMKLLTTIQKIPILGTLLAVGGALAGGAALARLIPNILSAAGKMALPWIGKGSREIGGKIVQGTQSAKRNAGQIIRAIYRARAGKTAIIPGGGGGGGGTKTSTGKTRGRGKAGLVIAGLTIATLLGSIFSATDASASELSDAQNNATSSSQNLTHQIEKETIAREEAEKESINWSQVMGDLAMWGLMFGGTIWTGIKYLPTLWGHLKVVGQIISWIGGPILSGLGTALATAGTTIVGWAATAATALAGWVAAAGGALVTAVTYIGGLLATAGTAIMGALSAVGTFLLPILPFLLPVMGVAIGLMIDKYFGPWIEKKLGITDEDIRKKALKKSEERYGEFGETAFWTRRMQERGMDTTGLTPEDVLAVVKRDAELREAGRIKAEQMLAEREGQEGTGAEYARNTANAILSQIEVQAQKGAIVPGSPSQAKLAIVHGQEAIIPKSKWEEKAASVGAGGVASPTADFTNNITTMAGLAAVIGEAVSGGIQAIRDVFTGAVDIVGRGAQDEFIRSVAQRESGMKPGITNTLGYQGYFQFGAPALVDLGVYNRMPTPAMPPPQYLNARQRANKHWGGIADPSVWSGKFGWNSAEDFLGDPAGQINLFKEWIPMVWRSINRTSRAAIGRNIGGVLITKSGLIGGAHLMGGGGVNRWVRTGGVDMADAYGTSIKEYIGRFGGFDLPEFQRGGEVAVRAGHGERINTEQQARTFDELAAMMKTPSAARELSAKLDMLITAVEAGNRTAEETRRETERQTSLKRDEVAYVKRTGGGSMRINKPLNLFEET